MPPTWIIKVRPIRGGRARLRTVIAETQRLAIVRVYEDLHREGLLWAIDGEPLPKCVLRRN